MKVVATELPGVLIVEPRVHRDARGLFFESWSEERYAAAGIGGPFVQDNVSLSPRGVLRGLHFQWPKPQGKLVSVLHGEVFDVAVDIRVGSPTFRRCISTSLSAANRRQLWIPPGFAHGFQVTSDEAIVVYRCTEYYAPECERTIAWNDPELAIAWPDPDPILSARDREAAALDSLPGIGIPLTRAGE